MIGMSDLYTGSDMPTLFLAGIRHTNPLITIDWGTGDNSQISYLHSIHSSPFYSSRGETILCCLSHSISNRTRIRTLVHEGGTQAPECDGYGRKWM